MRNSQTCSKTTHRTLESQHSADEGESLASEKTGYSVASSSSFSLQDCINEFRARKVRRSSQSQSQSQSNQNTDDDLINQNKSNKHSERISKPCKDGFCYCFTSDSDDFRIHKTDEKKRSRRSEATNDEQISDFSNNNNHNYKMRSGSWPTNPKSKKHNIPTKNGPTRTVTAISKLKDSSRTSKAPLIHIIQEIHNNYVVSEVHVNKNKIPHKNASSSRKQMTAEQRIINVPDDISTETSSPVFVDRVSEIDSLTEQFKESSLNTSSRSSDKKGGRLLKKRLSNSRVEYKPRNLSTPPRKPPRNIPIVNSARTSVSTTPSIRDAERVLDEFLRLKGIPIPKIKQTQNLNRRSFPQPKSSASQQNELVKKTSYKKPVPSCPSLSDIERLESEKSVESCGIIHESPFTYESPKIKDMLNLDTKTKNFQTNNSECGPQVGWRIPPKLDIDTVDGAYHNLVANMESKVTPVKSEMPNNKTESQKFILAEQLKNFVSHSPWSSKKQKNQQNIKKSHSFLNTSKTKLLRFVTKKSPPSKQHRSIGVQTSVDVMSTEPQGEEKRFSLQSPPGSYFSNTPAKTSKSSQTEFDFSRTVQSPPREEKIPQRKQLFPATHNNIPKEKPPRKINSKKNQNQTYKSYTSDLDKDLNISKMGQVLSNIRNRLEASDDHAVETFRDIKRKEENNAAAAAVATTVANTSFSYDCVDGYDYQRVFHVSAQADVHNDAEPSYSEIEEDSFYIAGSPVTENATGIEHFVVENDPKAIYAKINKTPKKSKSQSNFFNNSSEQNSPPKLRNVSKTDLSTKSEIFLENLTSENNASYFEKAEKIPNALQEEKMYMELDNLDESYVSVNSFRESFAKESDAVSYELPDDCTNPITVDNLAGNQSTPKKTTHFTKFGNQMPSEECLHQTSSCPATPGWLLNNEELFLTAEGESMSLQEQTSATKVPGKPSNSTLWRYRTLKDKLRKSFRKSRHFIKNESKRLSGTFNSQKPPINEPWDESSLCIRNLFSMDEQAPVNYQLTQAVNICRLIPELEDTPEMVEAERLLLYSTVRRDAQKLDSSVRVSQRETPRGALLLKSLRLPIKKSSNGQELFFNYYYIGVFSHGRQIRSTKSAECTNGEAIFRNCNISFDNLSPESKIRCEIFMLRLRKVTPNKRQNTKPKKLSEFSSTSSEEVVSRFRPHASFTLEPQNFKPFNVNNNCPQAFELYFCLHSDSSFDTTIVPEARNTNLMDQVHVCGEMELFFKKFSTKGFLNVQDVNKKHSWNLRWCELSSLTLNIWNCPNDVADNEPVLRIDLCKCKSLPIQCAAREICARSRSFCLEFEEQIPHSVLIFSADSLSDLNSWISALNEVLEFIADWIK